MKTVCKFTCVSQTIRGAGKDLINDYEFIPVVDGSEENKAFWKWTPSGKLQFSSTNQDVKFESGKNYYLTITEA